MQPQQQDSVLARAARNGDSLALAIISGAAITAVVPVVVYGAMDDMWSWLIALAVVIGLGWLANGRTFKMQAGVSDEAIKQAKLFAIIPALAVTELPLIHFLIPILFFVCHVLITKADKDFSRAKDLNPSSYYRTLVLWTFFVAFWYVWVISNGVDFIRNVLNQTHHADHEHYFGIVNAIYRVGAGVVCYAMFATIFKIFCSVSARTHYLLPFDKNIEEESRQWLAKHNLEPSIGNVRAYISENASALFSDRAKLLGVSVAEYMDQSECVRKDKIFIVPFMVLAGLYGSYMVISYLVIFIAANMNDRKYRPGKPANYGLVRGD